MLPCSLQALAVNLQIAISMFTSRRYSVDDILDLIVKHWSHARNTYWYRTMRQFASPQGYADRLYVDCFLAVSNLYFHITDMMSP